MFKRKHTKNTTKSATDDLKSDYERGIAKLITERLNKPIKEIYEQVSLKYQPPVKEYTPDWQISDKVFIETKGYFDSADRSKLLLVKKQNPDITICLLFQTPNRTISKTSKTTYAKWAEKHGFPWSGGKTIPDEWYNLK